MHRIREITRPKVYGLVDGCIIFYVGVTTRALERRRVEHLQEAKRWDCPVHQRIGEAKAENIGIIELSYDSEYEAVEDLQPDILNQQAGRKGAPEYTGPAWTPEEVDLLEEASGPEVVRKTGYDKNRVYDAKHRLDLV